MPFKSREAERAYRRTPAQRERKRVYMRGYNARNSERRIAYMQEWGKRNPDKVRANRVKRRYGLGRAEHDQMLASQGGLCATCRIAAACDVDHDHRTGRVRGLLCRRCNLIAGFLERDDGLIEKIRRYLSGAD